MRKLLLATVALGGLTALTSVGASAAPLGDHVRVASITHVDYYWNHRHWHHRHWEHNRWRYY